MNLDGIVYVDGTPMKILKWNRCVMSVAWWPKTHCRECRVLFIVNISVLSSQNIRAWCCWAFVLSCTRRASNDLWPVLSWITFLGTPVSWIWVTEVAHMLFNSCKWTHFAQFGVKYVLTNWHTAIPWFGRIIRHFQVVEQRECLHIMVRSLNTHSVELPGWAYCYE